MLPDENPETPELEHDDNQSDAGHEVAADDEIDGGEDDGDAGGGAEDDLGDDVAGEDEGQAGQPDQVRGKGNREFGALRQRARQAEQDAAALKARLDAIEANTRRQSTAESEAAERARLELMSPDEKTEYLVSKTRNEVKSEIQQLRYENWEANDKAQFRALCADNPAISAIANEIEEARAAAMRAGQGTPSREAVAYWLIGQKAIARAKTAKTKQAKRGQQNIQRQTARPGNAGSDRAADGRSSGTGKAALEKRLKDVQI